MQIFIISFFLVFASLTHGRLLNEDNGSADQMINCDEADERCEYLARHVTSEFLIQKIETEIFNIHPLSVREGKLFSISTSVLGFWFNDPELRSRVAALIPIYDSLEKFIPKTQVVFTTEVYSMTETAYEGFSVSLSSFLTDVIEAPRVEVNVADGIATAGLKIGNNTLAALLNMQKTNESLRHVETYQITIPNRSNLNFNNTKRIIVTPITPGQFQSEFDEVGLRVGGTVSINADDQDIIKVDNFNFTYGVEIAPSDDGVVTEVQKLNSSTSELTLIQGSSTIVAMNSIFEGGRINGLGLFKTGTENRESFSRLLIITRAQVISFDKLYSEVKRQRVLNVRNKFNPEEVEKLPFDHATLEEVAESIKPSARLTPNGGLFLSFDFDKELASQRNYDRSIVFNIYASNKKSSSSKGKRVIEDLHRSVQNLVLAGLVINQYTSDAPDFLSATIPNNYFQANLLQLVVEMTPFSAPRNERFKIKKTFYFNPQTNEFIRSNDY